MTGALVPISSNGSVVVSGLDQTLSMLPAIVDLSRQIANTNFVPKAYRGRPAEITAAVLYGHELGIGPMTSLQQIAVVEGRPAPSAQLGVALALAAGHEVWVVEATNTRAVVSGRRRGSEEVQTVTWTMDDAKRAGLDRKDNWRGYPRAMLTHRAQAELVRNVFPDVLGGIAMFAEEIDDQADTPTPQAIEAAPSTTKRRRRAAPAAVEPEPEPTGDTEAPEAPAATTGPDVDLNAPPPQLTAPGAETPTDGPSSAQMKAMHASLGDAGFVDRDDRLAFVAAVIGRQVDTSKAISSSEAGKVIDAAQAVAAGTVGIVTEPDGTWRLSDLHEPDGGG